MIYALPETFEAISIASTTLMPLPRTSAQECKNLDKAPNLLILPKTRILSLYLSIRSLPNFVE